MAGRHRRRPRRDAGTTLAELLVAMGLATVVLGATAWTFVNGLHTSNQSQDRTLQTQQLRTALEEVVRVLRTASPVPNPPNSAKPAMLLAAPKLAAFYASNGTLQVDPTSSGNDQLNCPTEVIFSVDSNNNLVETDYLGVPYNPYSGSGPTCQWPGQYIPPNWPTRTRVLATNLVSPQPAGDRIFTYYAATDDDSSNPSGVPASSLPLNADGSVASTAISNISSVEVSLTVQLPGSSAATQVIARATLPPTNGLPIQPLPSAFVPPIVSPSPTPSATQTTSYSTTSNPSPSATPTATATSASATTSPAASSAGATSGGATTSAAGTGSPTASPSPSPSATRTSASPTPSASATTSPTPSASPTPSTSPPAPTRPPRTTPPPPR